ncbi:hypothetical protein TNCV_2163481 [Trichonephila clavipes]|nr:hypothetical protein TNCV_2163481 [Trichonephila clavipes]
MRNVPFRRTQRPKSNKIIPCKTNSGPPAVLTGEGIKLPCIFEAVREIYGKIFGLASFEKVDRFRSEIQLAGHPVRGLKVCELHFSDDAIRRYTEAYNEKTGEKICVPLKRYRLLSDRLVVELISSN